MPLRKRFKGLCSKCQILALGAGGCGSVFDWPHIQISPDVAGECRLQMHPGKPNFWKITPRSLFFAEHIAHNIHNFSDIKVKKS